MDTREGGADAWIQGRGAIDMSGARVVAGSKIRVSSAVKVAEALD